MKKIQMMLSALLIAAAMLLTGCTQQSAPGPEATLIPTATPVAAAAETQAPVASAEPEVTAAPEVTAEPVPTVTVTTINGEKTPADVLVVVNGVAVTRADADLYANDMLSYYANYGYDTTDPDLVAEAAFYGLDTAVSYEVLRQKRAQLGLDSLTDAEREAVEKDSAAYWEQIIEYYMSNQDMGDEPTELDKAAARMEVLSMLESYGYTFEVLLAEDLENAMMEKLEAVMVADARVTEEEILADFNERAAYDQQYYADDVETFEYMTEYYGETSYYTPAGYRRVQQILLEADAEKLAAWQNLAARLEEQDDAEEQTAESGEKVTAEAVEAARQAVMDSVAEKAAEIRSRFDAGESFESLIDQYNIDPGMADPAMRAEGYRVHTNSIMYDPEFIAAAFSVGSVGEMSEPRAGSYGVYIVYYMADVPAGPVEMTEEIRQAIYDELLYQKEEDLFTETLQAWRTEAGIVYSDEAKAILSAGESEIADNE